MKTALGFLVLLSLFAVAALWQESLHRQVIREHEAARSDEEAPPSGGTDERGAPDGWGLVTVGRPSGADPVPRPTTSPEPLDEDRGDRPTPTPGEFELRVSRGQRLWTLTHSHYGRATPDLVRRLAEYNHLADPDVLPEGTLLRLPPIEKLEDR